MFFSIDGVDGAGKSTQIELFRQWLSAGGHAVVACRDPGSTQLGESLRDIVLQGHEIPIHRRSEMLLYMAARAQLVEEVIRPALAAGRTVVSDRYLLANVVYQGHAGGLGADQVWRVGEVAIGGLHPDLVVVLDLDVGQATARRAGPADRMESQGQAYLQRVRDGFLVEARRQIEPIVVIDASSDVETIQRAIQAAAHPFVSSVD